MEKHDSIDVVEMPALNPRQQKIYLGLKSLGPLPAAFYKDAVGIMGGSLIETKSYIIAHLARELDGSIRDIFSLLENKDKETSHMDIILRCLGKSDKSEFAIEWKEISSQFAGLAHRSKPHESPREVKRIIELWKKYEEIIYQLVGNYFALQKRLEIAIRIDSPTDQFLKVLPNMLELDASKLYFFKELKSGKWLDGLIKNGWYDVNQAPGVRKTKEGIVRERWFPLFYLENLSELFREGKDLELIPSVLDIICQISERHRMNQDLDNDNIWMSFTKTLVNIPNELVPLHVLDLIPIWLTTEFDAFFSSHDLLGELLPKFLNDSPTKDDIVKGERILLYLLDTKESESKDLDSEYLFRRASYESRIYLNWLENAQSKDELAKKVAKHCSVDCLLRVASILKKLVRDIPNGIADKFSIDDHEYKLKLSINNQENYLLLSCSGKYENGNEEKVLLSLSIQAFDDLSEFDIKEIIREELLTQGCNFLNSEFFYQSIDHLLDILFSFDNSLFETSISEYSRNYSHGKFSDVVLSFLKDILIEKGKSSPEQLSEVILAFTSKRFRLPIFRRLALYLIGEFWQSQNHLFWNEISINDEKGYFSDHRVWKDLYYLLNKNVKSFNLPEKEEIQKIIKGIPKDEIEEQYYDLWRLKWYSALSDDEFFKQDYLRLSNELQRTKQYYDKSGQVLFGRGSISPFSKDEILAMDNSKIIEKILSFRPQNGWEESDISGFSETIEAAVTENPEHFDQEIQSYKDVYFIYAYHLLNGFKRAWELKRKFSWSNVLNYCCEYASQDGFARQALKIENDRWNSTSDLVARAIGLLITSGTQHDENSFDEKYLPYAEKVLVKLCSKMDGDDKYDTSDMLYADYLLNSTNGIVLRAAFDLALRKARLMKTEETQSERLKPVSMELFESALQKNIIDIYIMCGWFFGQFHFLNKEWILDKLVNFNYVEEKLWKAFMGGYMLQNPPCSKEIYLLMLPHYKKAIESGCSFNHRSNKGVARHIFHFLYWEFESIDGNNLTTKLLDEGSSEMLSDYVSFLWEVSDKIPLTNSSERVAFRENVFLIWQRMMQRFRESTNGEDRKVLKSCIHLMSYWEKLDSKIFSLVIETVPFLEKDYEAHHLIDELNRLKESGEQPYTAIMIGEIFKKTLSISKPQYPMEDIQELTEFLYKQGDLKTKDIADFICEEYARSGNASLTRLFKLYNEVP